MKRLVWLWLLAGTQAFRITEPYKSSTKNTQVLLEYHQGSIGSDLFARLPASVKELYIDRSSLDRIEKGALCSHPFRNITIYGSNLPQLTREMLGNCPSLMTFKYSNDNNCTGEANFAPDMFSGLENLQNLWIHDAWKFPRMTKDFVANSTSVEFLQVADSNLSSIEAGTLDHLGKLKYVDFWKTQLESVDGLWSKLKSLQDFIIFKSNVKSFPWHELRSSPDLKSLDLISNKMEDFDGKAIAKNVPGLTKLRFSRDQVPCDKYQQGAGVLRKSLPSAEIVVETC